MKYILAGLALLVLLGCLALALPPVRERLVNRLDQLRIRVFYALNPPEEAVFTPDAQVALVVQQTLTQMAAVVSPTPLPTATQTVTPLPPDVPTPTETPTLAPPPASGLIDNMPYVDQHYGFNNCAPANLTMMLKFYGWPGTREEVSDVLKPFAKDKNVMPYELVDYVNNYTGVRALSRIGGSPEVVKRLVTAGYPVLVERGVYLRDISGVVSWMGHYQIVYGYDDTQSRWQVKDSFEQGGDKYSVSYDEMLRGWRSFDYTFIVVYPAENEGIVTALLGDYASDSGAAQIAAQKASDEAAQLQGQDQFFALFNRGSALVTLTDYNGAAKAYDDAFQAYAKLSGDQRPWRMLWYQTGPYFAYFHSGRLQDVVNLADKTIKAASEPYIEESYYWRAYAKVQLGDTAGAIDDLRQSLAYHPSFGPSVTLLQQLGATP